MRAKARAGRGERRERAGGSRSAEAQGDAPRDDAPRDDVTGEGFHHLSVMPREVLDLLKPQSGGLYVDTTLGGGGHSGLILDASSPDGRVIGVDRDPSALLAAGSRLERFGDRFTALHGRFGELETLLASRAPVDGVLADLGVSSPQLDVAERGFSFMKDGPLDMRMDPGAPISAADLVNEASVGELEEIFRTFGEERFAGKLARAIVHDRTSVRFETTGQLAGLCERVIPRPPGPSRIHPATRAFQGLRIAVNDELGELTRGLEAALKLLRPGGRVVIISFHSLEDRIVKHTFRQWALDCVCPPDMPVCQCDKRSEGKVLTPHPIEAGGEELAVNPRARSARLRGFEKRQVQEKRSRG